MKLVEKNGIYYLDEGRLDLYTPQSYLSTINRIDGETMNAFGLMFYKYYKNPKDTKPTKVGVLNDPSMITLYPVDINMKVKDKIWDGIYEDANENEYTVLSFNAGGRLMNQNIVKNLDNVTTFMDLMLGRKLDNNIPYNMLVQCWIKNLDMNGESLGIPYTDLNLVVYELCRSKKDNSKRFGELFGRNPKMSPVGYEFVGIRQICASNSVFTALSFEDMNSMLDSSLNITQKEKDQKVSPVEQIIKF